MCSLIRDGRHWIVTICKVGPIYVDSVLFGFATKYAEMSRCESVLKMLALKDVNLTFLLIMYVCVTEYSRH
jgi:hypothetical protein